MTLCKKQKLSFLALISVISFLWITPVFCSDTNSASDNADKCSEIALETPRERKFLSCLQEAIPEPPIYDYPEHVGGESRRKRNAVDSVADDYDYVEPEAAPTLNVDQLQNVTKCVYNLVVTNANNAQGVIQRENSTRLFCKRREKIRGCINYLFEKHHLPKNKETNHNDSMLQNHTSTIANLFNFYDATLQCKQQRERKDVETTREALVLQLSSPTQWFTPNLAMLLNHKTEFRYLRHEADECLLDRLKDLTNKDSKTLSENPFKFFCESRQNLTNCYKTQAYRYNGLLNQEKTVTLDYVNFTDKLTETVCTKIPDIHTIIEQLAADKNCFKNLTETVLDCVTDVNYNDTKGKIYTSAKICRDFQATKYCYEKVYSEHCTESETNEVIRTILTQIENSTNSLCVNLTTGKQRKQSPKIKIEENITTTTTTTTAATTTITTENNETSQTTDEHMNHPPSKITYPENSVNPLKCNIPILATFLIFHFYSVL